ncbi:uncharacterized protein I303_102136 [Kwoniella dejecticola CBS 10117]|uniref:Ca3427-like PBP 2 domain-containing protein n=1 Tax=Kwoniella dejecticola CBS 10117 TaxID=1296121 RepID=A0A1A6ABS5_9TREE|nr:uncharacterized protein I303_01723 [Kwoniella dejecticola CBS 10117]OBR87516.1 hypothetical protein I303_01723 [Kwoniella dejecticola CBS 10117]
MTKLKIGWHREHFLSPLLQFAAQDKGETFELVECPGGTGEMQVKLKSGEIDLCIALTDALIAGIANGQTSYKLVGRYIASPLRWAIITGKDSKYNSVDDLKGTTFGISRLGSGSQVMASVLSLNEGWTEDEQPKFKVNGQFKPLRDSVNSGETSVFLWEWFTTKPYVDSGEVRFIGSVYTPWPCWHIAASPSTSSESIKTFLLSLQPYVQNFNSPQAREKDDIDFVHSYFGHDKEDVKEWLKSVKWEEHLLEVKEDIVRETLRVLAKAGVVKPESAELSIDTFVNTQVASVI